MVELSEDEWRMLHNALNEVTAFWDDETRRRDAEMLMRRIDSTRKIEEQDLPFAVWALRDVARVLDEELGELFTRTGYERAEFAAFEKRLLSEGGG